jgi:hypothetical protein
VALVVFGVAGGLAFRLAYGALRLEMAAEGQTSIVEAFRDCTEATSSPS